MRTHILAFVAVFSLFGCKNDSTAPPITGEHLSAITDKTPMPQVRESQLP